jgi:RNA-binding protein
VEKLWKLAALERFDEDQGVWFQEYRGTFTALLALQGTGNLYNAAMELSERQRKYLRGLGHALSPVLLIGNAGVTPAVIAEAKRALHDHELIKVKFRGAEREARDAGLAELAANTESVLLQRVGHTALYYKRRIDRPGIVIPDA